MPLQKTLLSLWIEAQVDEQYQDLILTHLDQLPSHLVEEAMTAEIKQLREGSHAFLKINTRNRNRAKLLETLSSLLNEGHIDDNMPYICEQLDLLRN